MNAIERSKSRSPGIVICAGGIRYSTCAWVLIRLLRERGCTLPIEVWYRGEEEADRQWIELVEPLGVRCTAYASIPSVFPGVFRVFQGLHRTQLSWRPANESILAARSYDKVHKPLDFKDLWHEIGA